MYEHRLLKDLDDYFKPLKERNEEGVYFYRINGYNEAVKDFIFSYYEEALRSGVVIEGKIPNPDEHNLSYYEEIMGLNFQMSVGFINSSLNKWLPRMDARQREQVTLSLYDALELLRREGKNDNMLKNAYIKFMCWLYYKFERIITQLGNDKVPKILYEGAITAYELRLFAILSKAGCDIVLLQTGGDGNYLKLDPESRLSTVYPQTGLQAFPDGFGISMIRKKWEENIRLQRLYGQPSRYKNCTNAWIESPRLAEILKEPQERGDSPEFFYNCFFRLNGVEDKLSYPEDLYQFQLLMKKGKRRMIIVEKKIEPPAMDEIASIKRGSYKNREQMLSGLIGNLRDTADIELQRLTIKAFIDVMAEEGEKSGENVNKLTNQAVYVLCWLKRYRTELFSKWKMPETACFIYLGGCNNENEALFLKLLSKLPVDVLVLKPDLRANCCLQDKYLCETTFENSMELSVFPRENADIRMGTAAYHAERELDSLMYQDSGMYRNRQYQKAVSITLNTMYEEIALLWDQEMKYRPNFSVVDDIVNVPVIFAKVSGVKDGDVQKYWSGVRQLITEDTLVVKKAPFIKATDENPIKPFVTSFFKNGRLLKGKIKEHHAYPYGFLREEIQDHLLNKLELLIQQKTIRGTMENGMEYTIISTILNLRKDILKMMQRFDFTKKNPKLIYINTAESIISPEDGIMAAFLNLAGFDVLFCVPTGYQNVEKHFAKGIMEEHQIGEYVYDLQTPDFDRASSNVLRSWREKIFKRGNKAE